MSLQSCGSGRGLQDVRPGCYQGTGAPPLPQGQPPPPLPPGPYPLPDARINASCGTHVYQPTQGSKPFQGPPPPPPPGGHGPVPPYQQQAPYMSRPATIPRDPRGAPPAAASQNPAVYNFQPTTPQGYRPWVPPPGHSQVQPPHSGLRTGVPPRAGLPKWAPTPNGLLPQPPPPPQAPPRVFQTGPGCDPRLMHLKTAGGGQSGHSASGNWAAPRPPPRLPVPGPRPPPMPGQNTNNRIKASTPHVSSAPNPPPRNFAAGRTVLPSRRGNNPPSSMVLPASTVPPSGPAEAKGNVLSLPSETGAVDREDASQESIIDIVHVQSSCTPGTFTTDPAPAAKVQGSVGHVNTLPSSKFSSKPGPARDTEHVSAAAGDDCDRQQKLFQPSKSVQNPEMCFEGIKASAMTQSNCQAGFPMEPQTRTKDGGQLQLGSAMTSAALSGKEACMQVAAAVKSIKPVSNATKGTSEAIGEGTNSMGRDLVSRTPSHAAKCAELACGKAPTASDGGPGIGAPSQESNLSTAALCIRMPDLPSGKGALPKAGINQEVASCKQVSNLSIQPVATFPRSDEAVPPSQVRSADGKRSQPRPADSTTQVGESVKAPSSRPSSLPDVVQPNPECNPKKRCLADGAPRSGGSGPQKPKLGKPGAKVKAAKPGSGKPKPPMVRAGSPNSADCGKQPPPVEKPKPVLVRDKFGKFAKKTPGAVSGQNRRRTHSDTSLPAGRTPERHRSTARNGARTPHHGKVRGTASLLAARGLAGRVGKLVTKASALVRTMQSPPNAKGGPSVRGGDKRKDPSAGPHVRQGVKGQAQKQACAEKRSSTKAPRRKGESHDNQLPARKKHAPVSSQSTSSDSSDQASSEQDTTSSNSSEQGTNSSKSPLASSKSRAYPGKTPCSPALQAVRMNGGLRLPSHGQPFVSTSLAERVKAKRQVEATTKRSTPVTMTTDQGSIPRRGRPPKNLSRQRRGAGAVRGTRKLRAGRSQPPQKVPVSEESESVVTSDDSDNSDEDEEEGTEDPSPPSSCATQEETEKDGLSDLVGTQNRIHRLAVKVLRYLCVQKIQAGRVLEETMVRREVGDNPDVSKALRLLLTLKKVRRLGQGGRPAPYQYDVVPEVLDLYLDGQTAKGTEVDSCATSSATPAHTGTLPCKVSSRELNSQPDLEYPTGPTPGAGSEAKPYAGTQPSSPPRKLEFTTPGAIPLSSPVKHAKDVSEGCAMSQAEPESVGPPNKPTHIALMPAPPNADGGVNPEAIAGESKPGPEASAATGGAGREQRTSLCGITVSISPETNRAGQTPTPETAEPEKASCGGGGRQGITEPSTTVKRKRGRPRKTCASTSASTPSPPPDQPGGTPQEITPNLSDGGSGGRTPHLQLSAGEYHQQPAGDVRKPLAERATPLDEVLSKSDGIPEAGTTEAKAPNNMAETGSLPCRTVVGNKRGRKRVEHQQSDSGHCEPEQDQRSTAPSDNPDPPGLLANAQGTQLPKELPSVTAQASCAIQTPVGLQMPVPVPTVAAVSNKSEDPVCCNDMAHSGESIESPLKPTPITLPVRTRPRKRIYKTPAPPVAVAAEPRRPGKTPTGRPRGRPRKSSVPPETPSHAPCPPREGLRTRAAAATNMLPRAQVSTRITKQVSSAPRVLAPVSSSRTSAPRIKQVLRGSSGSPLSVLARACARLSAEDELNPLVFPEPLPITLKERIPVSSPPLGPQRRALAKSFMSFEDACLSLSRQQTSRTWQPRTMPDIFQNSESAEQTMEGLTFCKSAALPQPRLLELLQNNGPLSRVSGTSCPPLWTDVPVSGTADRPGNLWLGPSAYGTADAFLYNAPLNLTGVLPYLPRANAPAGGEYKGLDSVEDEAASEGGMPGQRALLQQGYQPSAAAPENETHIDFTADFVPSPPRAQAMQGLLVTVPPPSPAGSAKHQADTLAWSLAANFGISLTEAKKMAQQTNPLPPVAQPLKSTNNLFPPNGCDAASGHQEAVGACELDKGSQTPGEEEQAWLQQWKYPSNVLSPVSGRRQATRFPAPAASASYVPASAGLLLGTCTRGGVLRFGPRFPMPAVAAPSEPDKPSRKRLRTGEENDESKAMRPPPSARQGHPRALGPGVYRVEGAPRPLPERSLSTADEDSCELSIDELCIGWPATHRGTHTG